MRAAVGRSLCVLLLGAALGSALAQKAREDVRAEAASAARAGQIDRGELTREPAAPSVRERTEVKAESRAAVKAGTIDRGEVRSTPPAASDAAGKTRAEVQAEAASALGLRRPATPSEAARK